MYNKQILSIDHPNQESEKKEIVRTIKKEIVTCVSPTPPKKKTQTHYSECMRSFYLTSLPSTVMILLCVLIFSHRDNLHPVLEMEIPIVHIFKALFKFTYFSAPEIFPRPHLEKKYAICMLTFLLHIRRWETSPSVQTLHFPQKNPQRLMNLNLPFRHAEIVNSLFPGWISYLEECI